MIKTHRTDLKDRQIGKERYTDTLTWMMEHESIIPYGDHNGRRELQCVSRITKGPKCGPATLKTSQLTKGELSLPGTNQSSLYLTLFESVKDNFPPLIYLLMHLCNTSHVVHVCMHACTYTYMRTRRDTNIGIRNHFSRSSLNVNNSLPYDIIVDHYEILFWCRM